MPKKVNPEDKLVIVAGFVAPSIKHVIETKAKAEERSISFVLNRLLSTHPDIKRAIKQRVTA